MTGTVKAYEAGKTIKLSGPADKSYAFDLDERRPGRWDDRRRPDGDGPVHQGADGKESVTVVSDATANAVTAAEAPKMHSESVDEEQRPGRDHEDEDGSRHRNGQGIRGGQVDQGHGAQVEGLHLRSDRHGRPEDRGVSVGERVKVTFTKSDGGAKATTIVAYPDKA